eukprot:2274287-Amphidinium_carterae.1
MVESTRTCQQQAERDEWKEWHLKHLSTPTSVAFKCIKQRPFPHASALQIDGVWQTEPRVIMDGLTGFW